MSKAEFVMDLVDEVIAELETIHILVKGMIAYGVVEFHFIFCCFLDA